MPHPSSSLLRLIFPLWSGGNLPEYHFGAEMLAWLAPETTGLTERVPVSAPGVATEIENGIRSRSVMNRDLDSAAALIRRHAPDRVVVLGGDCLIDLEPFAWLSERWGDTLGILWLDTHPDVMTPAEYENAHAHVLGALLGHGDDDLTRRVSRPLAAGKVMIAGLQDPNEYEQRFIRERGIATCSADEIRAGSSKISDWIRREGITRLAIHFDLDVLDYRQFRAVMFARPGDAPDKWDGVGKGKLTLDEAARVIETAAQNADVVGLGIAEHLPWDAINLKALLARLPLLRPC